MRQMLELSKKALGVVTLLFIAVVPVGSQEEKNVEKLGPDERLAQQILQQVLESGEFTSPDEAVEKSLAALEAEFGKGHPLVLEVIESIALERYQQGRFDKARQLLEQLIEVLTKIKGKDHLSTLGALNNLAIVLQAQGELPNALAIKEQVLRDRSTILGDEHPDTLTAKASLAGTLYAMGDLASARAHFEEVLRARSTLLGDEHPDTLTAKGNLASILRDLGDLAGARAHEEEVLRDLSTILGDQHPDTLAAKANLASTLNALGDLAGARAREEEVLRDRSTILGNEHPDTLTAKANLAATLFAMGDLASARARFEEVLRDRSSILGDQHPDTLTAKANLAETLNALGDLAGARARAEEVLRDRSTTLGNEHPDTLMAKANLAGTLYALGDLDDARARFEEVLRERSRILGDQHPDTLKTKANLAGTLKDLGDLAGARAREEEVLRDLSAILGDEHPDTLTAKANLAITLYALGDLDGARTRFIEVLRERSRILGDQHPNTVTAKGNLASTLKALGDLADARAHEEEVLRDRSTILGDQHPDTLTAKANLAGTLYALGDLDGARTRFEEVLRDRSTILGDQHPDTLTAKADLAVTLKALGDLAGARAREEEVLRERSTILGVQHPDTLTAKANLAGTLYALGDLAGARAREEEVLRDRSTILGDEHPDTLAILANLALTYEEIGDWERARSSYGNIIESHRRAQGRNYIPATESEAKTLLGLGRSYQATEQLDEAQEAFGLALDAIEAQTERLDLSEEIRRRYRASFQVGYHSALAVAAARRDAALALHLSERYRAGNLRSLLRTQNPESLSAMPAEMEQKLRGIAVEYDQITRILDGLNPKRNAAEYQRFVDRQIELRRKREVIQSRWLREQLEHRDPVPMLDVPEVKRQLDASTALLIYNVGQKQTQLLVLFRDGELQALSIDLPSALLRQQVTRFRELVAPEGFKPSAPGTHDNRDPETRDRLGRWLFSELIPSDPRLESADRWLVLSDGPLHMLPFGALVRPDDVPGTWHFLAQHKPLHTVQSLATYADLRDRRRDDFRFVENNLEKASWIGFGDPIYPVKVADLGERQIQESRRIRRIGEERAIFDGMSELPNTEREIRGISNLLPESVAQVYLGAAATEEQAWSDLPQADMIHFATHGVALPHLPQFGMDPMDSFLALSLFDEGELRRRQLSHNGLLQAWEIIDLKLNADLVVLSACQTALGEDQAGDGLISLSRAFQIAGARSVLASLWAVSDQSTAEFMIRFYKHLLKGKTKDVALQDTQKEFIEDDIKITHEDGDTSLHDFSHPYYWAAFQLIGDYQ